MVYKIVFKLSKCCYSRIRFMKAGGPAINCRRRSVCETWLGRGTHGASMTRKLIFSTVILTTVFFLVALGMRNPALSHNHGPKQRPRAVIENDFKASVEICQDQQLDAVVSPVTAVSALLETSPSSFCTFVDSDTPAPAQHSLRSRAPPPISARNS